MISLRWLHLVIICTSCLLSKTSFALVQQTNGTTAMGWQTVPLSNNLPPHALAVAASTDPTACDFVAVASDSNNTFYFYLLDHNNLQLGWQKKEKAPFLNADVTNLQYGLGHFVAMGTDRTTGKPVVATSADNGKTWSQSLVFAGKGHYDNAAFSPKIGVMTGKDGAVALTTDGTNWVENSPPSGVSRKIVYTNVAPSGAPLDNQFQLCVALPPGQTTLCGFLLFQDIPILGSLLSVDGKNWSYTIPYPILRNQLLVYQNKVFLVTDTLMGVSYAYHDQINLDNPTFNGLQSGDSLLPIMSIFQSASYQQNWVGVGYDTTTGAPLSLFSDSRVLNNNIVFSTDLFPQPVRLVAANQSGFLAIGDDGTTYYSTPVVPTTTPASGK